MSLPHYYIFNVSVLLSLKYKISVLKQVFVLIYYKKEVGGMPMPQEEERIHMTTRIFDAKGEKIEELICETIIRAR